jgi:cytochrome c-type biogenesis protein CcmH/NrfF
MSWIKFTKIIFFLSITILINIQAIYSESTTTNLTEPEQIKEFMKVTSQIRCICLPSLPIKSCSYNNCEISALLKNFIENRIRQGESAEEIVKKMQTGFGESALQDPIIQKFVQYGNSNIVNGVVYGFGEKILAEPDSTPINFTLAFIILLGILGLYLYSQKIRLKNQGTISPLPTTEKYLKELD